MKVIQMKESDEVNHILITIPKKVKWEDYQKELDAVADGSQVMRFKVNHYPKNLVENESKIYLTHDGYIKGYMMFSGLHEGDFVCSTTGNEWAGKFIERTGPFHYLEEPIEQKGFQGWRYYDT